MACLYEYGAEIETSIDKMWTSLNAVQIYIVHTRWLVSRELDGGHSLVKIIIPAKLKNAIMNELKGKGITKEYLLPD